MREISSDALPQPENTGRARGLQIAARGQVMSIIS